MSERLLLLVESNTTGTGRLFARRAADLGVVPVLLCADPGRYPYAAEDRLRTVTVDTSDEAALWATVVTLTGEAAVVGVLTSSEYYVPTAAALARRLGLPGPDAEAVRACRDKAEQRRALAAAGVGGPGFAVVSEVTGALEAAREIGLPVVVKPVQGSGSLGVRLCADLDEVAAHAGTLLAATVNERGVAVPGRILVEEYLTGPEFSVEVFGTEAVVTVAKHVGPLPVFVEVGHDVPAPLPGDRDRALREAAVAAVRALGLGWGAAHVELRLTGTDSGAVSVIEVNPRLAGGMIPELVRRACGIDLVLAQVQAALGGVPELGRGAYARASIRFLTSGRDGVLAPAAVLADAVDRARAVPDTVEAVLYRAEGERVGPAEDFRGRVGHVIAVADHAGRAAGSADRAVALLGEAVSYTDPSLDPYSGGTRVTTGTAAGTGAARGVDTGRLKAALDAEAHRIVYDQYLADSAGDGLGEELRCISEVDRAHLIMLTECGIVDAGRAAALLRAIEELRGQDFAPVRATPMPRGVYLAYEGRLIEQLGDSTGGILHTGRSRNDLNATTTRLKTRTPYLALLDAVDRLAGVLLAKASEYQDVIMPAYTHGQPAVPISYGHYLAGVAGAVLRAYEALLDAGRQLDVNPLGAGAIGGTSVPIDPRRTAELLGFTSAAPNSVDAVASRDFVLDLLSASAVLGVTLARAGRDLSTWTSEEFGLLRVADTLVGSSSMMPQKRNPFLLEHIQGRSTASLGAFVSAASAMTTGGYTNAVAVGTEAVRHLWPGLSGTTDAVTLLSLVVAGTEPERARMTDRAVAGFTSATYLAERLVLDGMPFRAAHHLVGETVLGALDSGRSLVDAAESGGVGNGGLAPDRVAEACVHGGGPGSTAEGIRQADTHHAALRAESTARRDRWSHAGTLLSQAVLKAVTS
ncbi:argininosuccinate lyase [Streptomyces sp. SID3212]|uniref:argininosuccinate lyase n=1 Tax=Streptomyces sp. SID3212 TaxID=2690259 RepID=UPI00136ACD03|nr:argininosuccinate lyase [Streptomyces sp. SID3212]MYV51413.1 argininosuccinate lyase [Streptomyces sp. SID3212]